MKSRAVLTGVVLFLSSAATQAGLLPVDVNLVSEGATTRFEYSVLLQSDAVLKTGDFFTIYDFAGFVHNSNTQPSNFSFSSSNVGDTPAHVVPNDDPNLPNLTWTYTGAETEVGELVLGTFTASSWFNMVRNDSFTGQTHREVDGHLNGNITDTQVPVPCHVPAVPEPSTLLLLAAGAPLMLGVRAYRKMRGTVA